MSGHMHLSDTDSLFELLDAAERLQDWIRIKIEEQREAIVEAKAALEDEEYDEAAQKLDEVLA